MQNPTFPPVCFQRDLQLTPRTMDRLKRQQAFRREKATFFEQLSRRELEVLTLICQGLTNEQIAGQLYVAKNTVRTHRNNIWRALGIRTVVEAVWWGECFDLI
ncbi:MAG: LuxR C-terminal-related transcriptional regulator [Bacteroidota bacterium]